MQIVLPEGMAWGDVQAHIDRFDPFEAQRALCRRDGVFDIRIPEATDADVRELALADTKRFVAHMAAIGVWIFGVDEHQ